MPGEVPDKLLLNHDDLLLKDINCMDHLSIVDVLDMLNDLWLFYHMYNLTLILWNLMILLCLLDMFGIVACFVGKVNIGPGSMGNDIL